MKCSARVILLVALVLVIALPAVRAVAQTPDSAPLPAGAEQTEEADGRTYLFAALLLTWIGIVVFLAVLFRGQQRIGRRLDRLERGADRG